MSVHLIVARTSGPTGKVLADLIREAGVQVTPNGAAIVSYGVSLNTQKPSLNASAGRADKVDQLRIFRDAGIRVPEFWVNEVPTSYPVLARKRVHHGGTDIKPVFQKEEIAWRRAAGFAYFIKHVPIAREFRVWTYRRSHLGTYEKVMAHPNQYRFIGRNHRNGFAFVLVKSESVPRGAVELATNSIAALGLDFGAVDILEGLDGNFYVLEVNTAPGVEGAGRQSIRALAEKIARWDTNGHPNRRTER